MALQYIRNKNTPRRKKENPVYSSCNTCIGGEQSVVLLWSLTIFFIEVRTCYSIYLKWPPSCLRQVYCVYVFIEAITYYSVFSDWLPSSLRHVYCFAFFTEAVTY
jgi:hypothetical protein